LFHGIFCSPGRIIHFLGRCSFDFQYKRHNDDFVLFVLGYGSFGLQSRPDFVACYTEPGWPRDYKTQPSILIDNFQRQSLKVCGNREAAPRTKSGHCYPGCGAQLNKEKLAKVFKLNIVMVLISCWPALNELDHDIVDESFGSNNNDCY